MLQFHYPSEHSSFPHSSLFPLKLEDSPREPWINESLTLLEGSSVSLQCISKGNPMPTLTWLKDGELVGTITADEGSVLELRDIMPQAHGVYRCLAENEHGRASNSLNITVECKSLEKTGRDPPHMIVKHFGCTAIHNKALYTSIIHKSQEKINQLRNWTSRPWLCLGTVNWDIFSKAKLVLACVVKS